MYVTEQTEVLLEGKSINVEARPLVTSVLPATTIDKFGCHGNLGDVGKRPPLLGHTVNQASWLDVTYLNVALIESFYDIYERYTNDGYDACVYDIYALLD